MRFKVLNPKVLNLLAGFSTCVNTHMNQTEVMHNVARIIRLRLSDEYKIVLFGSWAYNTARPHSDIDIGILGKKPVPWNTLARIKNEVDELPTLRSVDIVDLTSVSFEFRKNALANCKEITTTNARDIFTT